MTSKFDDALDAINQAPRKRGRPRKADKPVADGRALINADCASQLRAIGSKLESEFGFKLSLPDVIRYLIHKHNQGR